MSEATQEDRCCDCGAILSDRFQILRKDRSDRCPDCNAMAHVKVIDKRGKNPGREPIVFPPDQCTDVLDTDDPFTFVAVFPGNRVPRQEFTVNKLEMRGLNLLKRKVGGRGPDAMRAIRAAKMRILKLTERAALVHEGRAPGTEQAEGAKVIH
jgi:DNA-directed RNA polymerase subunit RPC12/RpoP